MYRLISIVFIIIVTAILTLSPSCLYSQHIKDNGDMVTDGDVGDSFLGVGQYDCSKKNQAEWYFAPADQTKKQEVDSGFVVTNNTNKVSIYYPRILNAAAIAHLNIHVASANSDGSIEIRLEKIDGIIISAETIDLFSNNSKIFIHSSIC